MKQIQVRSECGCFALVDDTDFDLVSQFTWYCEHRGIDDSIKYIRGFPGDVRMHRVIMGLKPGDQIMVDHRNGDGRDNQRANLRLATRSQNLRNARKMKPGLYRFKGVEKPKGCSRYTAYIRIDGKRCRVSGFPTQEEAAMAYNVLARRHYGEFALLNTVEMG